MSIVTRFAVRKHLRNLENATALDDATLEESKQRLVEAGPGILPSLFDLTGDPGPRAAAQDVLSRLLNNDTLPQFFGILAEARRSIVIAVSEVLQAGQSYEVELLFEGMTLSSAVRAAIEPVILHRADDFTTSFLVKRLIEADPGDRKVLYRLIEQKTDRTAQDLVPLLRQSDWWMRVHGLKLIAEARDSEDVVEKIREFTGDESRYVRLESVEALGTMKDKGSISALCNALKDSDLKVHTAAIDALVSIGDPAAVPHLIHVLADESEYTRRGAVEVLNEVATPEAIADLVRALHDEDWWVRVRAADALGSLGGDRVVDAVLDLTKSEDVFIRRYAVEILNSIPTLKSVDHLIETLNDPDWWVRERSIDALGSTGDERAVEPLLRLLQTDLQAAPLCARALGKLNDVRAVEPLMALTRTNEESLRNSAVAALEELVQSDLPLDVRTSIREYLVNPNSASVRPGMQTGGAAANYNQAQAQGQGQTQTPPPMTDPNTPANLEGARLTWQGKPLDDVPRHPNSQEHSVVIENPLAPDGSGPPSGVIPPDATGQFRQSQVMPQPGGPEQSGVYPMPPSGDQTLQGGPNTLGGMPPGPYDTSQFQNGPPTQIGGQTQVGGFPSQGGAPSGPSVNAYSNLDPGSNLMGRYRVLRRIGAGGFGSVYLVEDGSVGEEVILKILYPHISMDQTMIQRFVQELKYNRRIVHPNVIRLYDFVELEHGHAISMEYFPGGDLGDLLASGRVLSITEVLDIVRQICLGLGAAHAKNIVHRDIKPANILVGEDLEVKICDFGLASMADSGTSRLTKSGVLIGTPHYMAPEQINGDDIDTRADLYSVGIMLFEMLAGHPPYQGENPVNILFQHLQGDIPTLAEARTDLAVGISELVRQVMDRDPTVRPQNVDEFISMISDLAA